MKTMIATLAILALTGCATTATGPLTDMRALPAAAMTPGPIPSKVKYGADLKDTVIKLQEVNGLLNLCIADKKTLADWILKGQADAPSK